MQQIEEHTNAWKSNTKCITVLLVSSTTSLVLCSYDLLVSKWDQNEISLGTYILHAQSIRSYSLIGAIGLGTEGED